MRVIRGIANVISCRPSTQTQLSTTPAHDNVTAMFHHMYNTDKVAVSIKYDTSIDNQGLPGHIITIQPCQEAHRLAHIFRHTRPAQGDQFTTILLDRLALRNTAHFAQLLVDQVPHRCADYARRVSVYSDLVGGHFHGEGLGKATYGPFAGAVVREQSEGFERDDAVDNKTQYCSSWPNDVALPSGANDLPGGLLLDKLPRRARVAIEDAEKVDIEHATDIFFREV